ncbi:adhesin [Cedecea colo]|uniref:adhesin n=1 Tax=Cedecea colo TaxID=2552946 RepID=UPI001911EB08|nr:adhesin [Cedecea colo]
MFSTIKETIAINAAIGTTVNTVSQLNGKGPFSYVDAIMAEITSAATTGKSIGASAVINMGGAAIGSGIKGKNPTNNVIGAVFGSVGGKVVDVLSPVANQSTKDVIDAVTGSAASELTGNAVKDKLDKRDKA